MRFDNRELSTSVTTRIENSTLWKNFYSSKKEKIGPRIVTTNRKSFYVFLREILGV